MTGQLVRMWLTSAPVMEDIQQIGRRMVFVKLVML